MGQNRLCYCTNTAQIDVQFIPVGDNLTGIFLSPLISLVKYEPHTQAGQNYFREWLVQVI